MTGATLGSTRLYDYSPQSNSIFIGYTFYGTQSWGKGINQAIKTLLLEYVFQFVDTVRFHIGAGNVRSQIAIQYLGATKAAEQPKLNFLFELTKPTWVTRTTPGTAPVAP